MLAVDDLQAHYGRAHILHGVSLGVAAGEVACLLGRNGAGKSTTMKAIMRLLPPTGGSVRFEGQDLAGLAPHDVARLGLGYVPEERRIFPELTVAENLEVGRRPPRPGQAPWTAERLYALFPSLGAMKKRPGGRMSGGEQQMLAIARTLMGNPRLLLLDEPSEGLAPVVVDRLAEALLGLKSEGLAILLSEQNPGFAASIADHAWLLETGHIRHHGPMAAVMADAGLRARYLSV
ncbi:ABC transporter ATP-binding protein [Roseomonas sp. 18066]|uniref:ABC transporter ATP-binding protein n=1 Tax=Roseomonas sp. 18066 TaxID=2681412 RepID=UPI001358E6AF|nr:ABC transporter ATP-binding protein [Roseomonas sp. 18066]